MDGAAQWIEMGLARARTGYLGTKSRGQIRPGYLLRYQFEFGRTFPRNCVANLYDSRALWQRKYSYTYHGHGMHTHKSSMIHTMLFLHAWTIHGTCCRALKPVNINACAFNDSSLALTDGTKMPRKQGQQNNKSR